MTRRKRPEGNDRLEVSEEVAPGAEGGGSNGETTVWDAMIRNNHVGAPARRRPR